jgi:hypothetical protein
MKNLVYYISTDKIVKRYLLFAAFLSTIFWIIFKFAYPYPDFFSDSYSYIDAAVTNKNINIWPIGYSKFLQLFHLVSNSDRTLVTFQYIMLELSCVYFFLTIINFSRIKDWCLILLFTFLFCNPFILYISNYISSDALFCSLSLIWATELIWIINTPNPYQFITTTLCMFFAFTMRYNAMYYPIITIIAYVLSKNKILTKIAGSTLIIPIIFAFLLYSRQAGKDLTGRPLTSILSGWQWGNNALYMRGHISIDTNKLPTNDCRKLDRISRNFFHMSNPYIDEILNSNMGCFFIQNPIAPLKQYMFKYAPPGDVKSWATVSPVFETYGIYLIKTHPIAYARYFLWPNTRNYFCPFLEKLIVYNMGSEEVWPIATKWFDYKSPKIYCINPTLQGNIIEYYPYYFLVLNIIFIGLIILVTSNRKQLQITRIKIDLISILIIFWLANFSFSMLANIIVLRYQLFPMIVITAGSLNLISCILNKKNTKYHLNLQSGHFWAIGQSSSNVSPS